MYYEKQIQIYINIHKCTYTNTHNYAFTDTCKDANTSTYTDDYADTCTDRYAYTDKFTDLVHMKAYTTERIRKYKNV